MTQILISRQDVQRVSSGRWLIPILAAMSGEDGSRFSVLARRLGMSKSVLSRHLRVLEDFGWVRPNPGHGHPLRPEYLLTPSSRIIAAWCERVMAQRARLGLEPQDLGRWSLPLLLELHGRERRFSELERGLEPITPRALSLALGQMLDICLVDRQLGQLALYRLTRRGSEFADRILSAR